MDPSILLLDCSDELEEKLRRQGFGVASACIGYAQPRKPLPAPVYEYDIIIYNPIRVEPVRKNVENKTTDKQEFGSPLEIMLKSAYESELRNSFKTHTLRDDIIRDFFPLLNHIQQGAVLLVFINNFLMTFGF